MFDKTSFPMYTDLMYRYLYSFSDQEWKVYSDEGCVAAISSTVVGKYDYCHLVSSDDITQKRALILDDFMKFQQRPEFKLLCICVPDTIKDFADYYAEIFTGAIFTRAKFHNPGCNPDDAWPQIERALAWLNTTDFFTAPASSIYHDSVAGGLCYHSLKVAERIVDLMRCKVFSKMELLGDAVFCALVHDWCKINLYESYSKNVKNEDTGVWEKVQAYRYTGRPIMNLGHGVTSMFLALKFFRLSNEEALAIRWHMGAYRTSDAEFDELQNSNEQFPLVHMLQFADQLSLVNY